MANFFNFDERQITGLNDLNPGDHIYVIKIGNHNYCPPAIYKHHMLVVNVERNGQLRVIHLTEDGVVQEQQVNYPANYITVLDYNAQYNGHDAVQRAQTLKVQNRQWGHCKKFVIVAKMGEAEFQYDTLRHGETPGQVFQQFRGPQN